MKIENCKTIENPAIETAEKKNSKSHAIRSMYLHALKRKIARIELLGKEKEK